MMDQQLLDVVSSTFSSSLSSPLFAQRLQLLKTHLYNRDFERAFPTSLPSADDDVSAEQQALLETYVLRWVPTRALCYYRIFSKTAKFVPESDLHIVSIGAGSGSESLAFQALLTNPCTIVLRYQGLMVVTIDVVDSCPGWESVLTKLTETSNTSSQAFVNFHHANAVENYSLLRPLISNANLITLMFTLNEMVSAQGKVPTTRFLIELIRSMKEGALILVSHVAPTISYLDCGLANLFCV
jgi:25S rRNA (uracil2843-N3)-methyltransferase